MRVLTLTGLLPGGPSDHSTAESATDPIVNSANIGARGGRHAPSRAAGQVNGRIAVCADLDDDTRGAWTSRLNDPHRRKAAGACGWTSSLLTGCPANASRLPAS